MKDWTNNTFNPFPDSDKVKKDLMAFHTILEEYQYLKQFPFTTSEDVRERFEYVKEQIAMLRKKKRKALL